MSVIPDQMKSRFLFWMMRVAAIVAREIGRWDFLISAGPLRIDKGHGSPLNPIATF